MSIEQFLATIDSSELGQEIQEKTKYLTDQKLKLSHEIDEKISTIILVKKRKLDYNAYTQATERLKMFLTSAKNLVDIYFTLLDDEEKIILYNFSDLKDLVYKIRFCLFRSIHNMNRMLIKQSETGNQEAQAPVSSQNTEERKTNNSKKKKRKKGKNSKMSIEQTGCMYKWILQNFNNPYPSQQQKQKLSADSKISISKVNYWFINMRERTLKKLMTGQNTGLLKPKKGEKGITEKEEFFSGQEESQIVDQSFSEQQSP